MAHIITAPRGFAPRPDILIAIILTGIIGFAAGQYSSQPSVTPSVGAEIEDWHGNVRR
ncbi:hypothetical protein RUESEDTHA_02118 [Ruegeria sp. THAF57]|uniref:hypothetical protein n=1 Tax=Ruegeria sp. THAF57 TaxID=2744555 RepID=UPI0015DEB234|nr:hypothetical protein [Ruegeria sp. THAF57]CAD0185232.1 hypothetical protein RUESEDTHA_02118 [Ruegeria sp. THAF57]